MVQSCSLKRASPGLLHLVESERVRLVRRRILTAALIFHSSSTNCAGGIPVSRLKTALEWGHEVN